MKSALWMTALSIAMVLPGPVAAQLQTSERIRILTNDGRSVIGTLAAMPGDSLLVQNPTEAIWVRQGDVAYLERSIRRHRKFGRNFALTVGSLAGAGAMLGAITYKKCVSNEFLGCLMAPEDRSDAFLMGGIIGGILGAPLGLLMGAAIQYDRWAPVSRGAEGRFTGLSIAPMPHRGIGLSASRSF